MLKVSYLQQSMGKKYFIRFYLIYQSRYCLKKPQTGHSYRIVSLTCDQEFHYGDDPCAIDATKYIIKAEEYGIPQARHRVILLGIREDRYKDKLPKLKTVDKYLKRS